VQVNRGYFFNIDLPWTGLGQPDECFATLPKLLNLSPSQPTWEPMAQLKLPPGLADARSAVDDMLLLVAQQGGEGLVLRSPTSPWVAKRVPWVLKVKKLSDAEGVVIGFTWGRRTDLGSRHLGRMGALVVECHTGKRLELSGFTDAEREVELLRSDGAVDYMTWEGRLIPAESAALEGKDATRCFEPAHFPIGSRVTYTYRDLSVDRVPKEARFLRTREET
jgi:ATP-dependent DNA ligase